MKLAFTTAAPDRDDGLFSGEEEQRQSNSKSKGYLVK